MERGGPSTKWTASREIRWIVAHQNLGQFMAEVLILAQCPVDVAPARIESSPLQTDHVEVIMTSFAWSCQGVV